MASNSASKKIYSPASSTYGYTLKASFTENSTNTSNNTSNITCTASLTSDKISFAAGTNYLRIYYYDNKNHSNGTLIASKTVGSLGKQSTVSVSGTIDATHNDNGSLSCYVKAVWTKDSGSYVPASNNISTDWTALTTIARYFSRTPTLTLTSKTETTATFSWSTSETCDIVQYKINNGSWVDVYSGSATSGTYTITGLTANTSYTIYGDYRRKDSQQWSTWAGYTVSSALTTYDYPKPTSTNDFTIGNGASVAMYNPLGRTYTLQILQKNTNTLLGTYTGTYNGVVNAEFKTADAIQRQYQSIPNSKSGTYYAKVTYGSVTKTSGDKTYSIDNTDGKCNPTFSVNNWSYVADLTNLTNNNQKVINNQATITFTVNTAATPKFSATIKEYQYKWGSKSNVSGQTTVVKGSGNILQVIAVDSRGYSTTTSLDLSNNLINYFTPTNTNATTERENGVEADTTLSLAGQLFNQTFGNTGEQNEITSAKYYVSTDNETWSTGYNITLSSFTLNENNYSLSDYQIHANGSSGGFPVGTKYYIKVELSDLIGTLTITNILVTDGKLALDVYQDNNNEYHFGINGLADPNYNLYLYGNTNIGTDLIENTAGTSTTKGYSQSYLNSKIPTMATSAGTSTTNGYAQSYLNNKLIDSSGTGWIRYTDGTQICYGVASVTAAFNSAWGSLWETPVISTIATFPKAFTSSPCVSLQSFDGYTAYPEIVQCSATKIYNVQFWRPSQSGSITFKLQYIAIGKWK